MERCKVEPRIYFSNSKKRKMLSKSGFKCSHCGKSININNGFTVEHVVPISLGGTNEIVNLVALCEECNKGKSNKVICKDIGGYYKYLSEKDLYELDTYVQCYIRNVDWFNYNNFMEDDEFVITPNGIPETANYIKDAKSLKTVEKVVLRKAFYKDLDSLYEYFKKRGNEENILRENLSILFSVGCIYMIKNSSNEIVGTFAVMLRKEFEDFNGVFPYITYISCTFKYKYALHIALSEIVRNITSVSKSMVVGIIFNVSQEEKHSVEVLNNLQYLKNSISYFNEEKISSCITNFSNGKSLKGSVKREVLLSCYKSQTKSYKKVISNRDNDLREYCPSPFKRLCDLSCGKI